ncbi:MAG: hypothetical protein ACRDK9_13060 [Solirubrobacterales bacterium]
MPGRWLAALVAGVLVSLVAVGAAGAGERIIPGNPVEVEGEPQEGETLTASAEALIPIFGPPDSFHWQRCDPAAVACSSEASANSNQWPNIPGAGAKTYTLVAADVDKFVRAVATYGLLPLFQATSARVGPIEPAPPPPPPPPTPAPPPPTVQTPQQQSLPPPVVHVSANLLPITGNVLVQEPGEQGFRVLPDPEQVPLGSIVDTRQGHVDVVTALNAGGETQVAEFWAGRFELTQTGGDNPYTEFELVTPPKKKAASRRAGKHTPAASERRRGSGRLWGRGKCKCRTRGRHSAGTVRGTWWLTIDRRNGTLTKVKQGTVAVRDFTLGKTVKVKAGERYLAHSKRKR